MLTDDNPLVFGNDIEDDIAMVQNAKIEKTTSQKTSHQNRKQSTQNNLAPSTNRQNQTAFRQQAVENSANNFSTAQQ